MFYKLLGDLKFYIGAIAKNLGLIKMLGDICIDIRL